MNRRVFLANLASLSALAVSPWLASCSLPRPVVVGFHPWIGYETLRLAREFRWLPAEVHLYEGKTASDSLAALRAGKIDAACLTLDEMLSARSAGIPLSAALIFDVSAGGDVVLARPSIRNLAGLAGKRLGVELNAVGALVLSKMLDAAGLSAPALTLVNLPVDKQLAAWRNGEVDAVISYEPTATFLLREGAQRLYDSRQMPDTIFDLLAVRSDLPASLHARVEGLVAAHFRGLSHLMTMREDAIYRIAALQGITAEEVRQALAGVVLPSLAANREYLDVKDGRLIRAAQTISALMVQHKLIKQEDDLGGLITPAWLPPGED